MREPVHREEESERDEERHLVAALRAEVNAGSTFANALSHFPREFSDIYIAVVGAGEQSGNLGMVLERLADELENRQALRASTPAFDWNAYLAAVGLAKVQTFNVTEPAFFQQLQRELGLSYLFITHNIGVVEYIADRVAVMQAGKLVEQGAADSVLQRPQHEYTRTLLAAVPRVAVATA